MLSINQFDVCQRGHAQLYYASVMSEPSNEFLKSQVLIYEAMIAEILHRHPRMREPDYARQPEASDDWHKLIGLEASLKTMRDLTA